MNSTSMMYNMVLLPLVVFGGFSCMLAFVFLLPGVGQGLALLWTLVMGDVLNEKRLAKKRASST